MSQTPQAFLHSYGYEVRHAPVAAPAKWVDASHREYPPPPPPMPTLTINSKGILQIHASLRERLGIRHGQPIDLIPPVWNSVYWHLDLRETALRRVLWHDNARPRALGISLPPGLVTDTLTLYLLPKEPDYANYYPLLPANAFTIQAH